MLAPQLLSVLATGETVSGARLAEAAGVSRAAIWKQVESLRSRGVPIESRGAAGYALPWPLQILDETEIRAALPARLARRLGALELHWEIDSTSSELQRRGAQAAGGRDAAGARVLPIRGGGFLASSLMHTTLTSPFASSPLHAPTRHGTVWPRSAT